MKHKIKTIEIKMEFMVDFDYSDEEFYFNKVELEGVDILSEASDIVLNELKSKLLEDLNANR